MKPKTNHTELLEATAKAESIVEFAFSKVDKILEKRGWKHTSSHPGSYWLWEKEHQGKTYVVSRDLAIRMEIEISDEYWEESW